MYFFVNIRHDTIQKFNMDSKADMEQLNLKYKYKYN